MKGKRCKWNPPVFVISIDECQYIFHPRTFSLPPQVGQVLESSGTRSKFSFLLRFIGYSCICAERLFRALEDDLLGTLEWKISRQAHNFFYVVCLLEPFHVPVFCLKGFTQWVLWVATMWCSVSHTHRNYLERWICSSKQSPKFEPAILCTFLWFNPDDALAH